MSLNSIFFMIFSVILIFSSIASLMARRMIYTLLWAMLVFLMVAGLFLVQGAVYNSMVQFLIYVVAIPILIGVTIMLINQKQQNKGLFYGRGKYTLWILLGIFSLIIILGDFLSMNNIFFEIVKNCSVYVNSYSDLFSISRNLLGVYPVLLLEFAAGIVLTIVGLSYYGK